LRLRERSREAMPLEFPLLLRLLRLPAFRARPRLLVLLLAALFAWLRNAG